MDDERQDPVTEPPADGAPPPGSDARAEGEDPGRKRKGPGARGGRPGRATRPMHPDRPCMNCGDPTPGEYCPSCGQRKVDVQVSVKTLFVEVLEDQFILDRRLPRTLGALLFKPGHLTIEHVNGRIVRYIHPFRLYLVSSLIFFVLLSFFSLRLVREAMIDEDGSTMALELEVGDDDATPAATPADSLAARVARLDSALATLDRSAADTTVPSLVRGALAANRAGIERQREVAAAQLDALQGDTAVTATTSPPAAAGDATGDTVSAAASQGAGQAAGVEAGEQTLAETFGWDESPPEVSFQPAVLDSVMEGQIRRLGAMTPREAAETLAGTFLNYVPTMMFLLLPIFAGVLKLLYIRRRRYYAEHFVFLLHVHSMVFVIAIVMLLLRGPFINWVEMALATWVLVYIYLAMKRVYGQGWLKTFAKYWTLGWMYFWILLISVVVAFLATLALF